jgi:hypothetical protein
MNLTLTMQFDSLDELQQFLTRSPAVTRNTPVATVTPITPDVVEQTATAVLVDIADTIVPEDDSVDLVALRTEIHTAIAGKAQSMEEPAILGAFITGFGVKKFSELPDDMLLPFQAAFNEEFGE